VIPISFTAAQQQNGANREVSTERKGAFPKRTGYIEFDVAAHSERYTASRFSIAVIAQRQKMTYDSIMPWWRWARPTMPYKIAETSRGPVEYRLEGRGPTVLVLNGGHCSRESRLSHERLADVGFSVLTPSRPGYDTTPSEVGESAQEAAPAIAALLDSLSIAKVDIIGISAAGPTALAFASQYPSRIHKVVLESAVTTPWDDHLKPPMRLLFGATEKLTWGLMRLILKLTPKLAIKTILRGLTTLDVDTVITNMTADDLAFVGRMIETSRSGTGFLNDIEHRIDDISTITAPVLVMYSPNDRSVPPKNAVRVAREVANCQLYEVPSDTHLIWIGKTANDVWQKRLSFLRTDMPVGSSQTGQFRKEAM
jgi:pimeloyl-ACP methyl ester carboxylesterase